MKTNYGFTSLGLVLAFIVVIAVLGGTEWHIASPEILPRYINDAAAETAIKNTTSGSLFKYEIIKDRTGDFYLPEVTQFHDPKIKDEVNGKIGAVANTLGCAKAGDSLEHLQLTALAVTREKGTLTEAELSQMTREQLYEYIRARTDLDVNTYVTYTEDDIFSFYINHRGYCGGAHLFSGQEFLTFDMRTGDRIPFEALFANFDRDSSAIRQIILSEMRHNRTVRAGDVQDPCIAMYSESGEQEVAFSYYLDATGVHISSLLPHVHQGCEEEVVLDVQRLAPFFGPSSLLSRLN
jgi:hypothetical protein